MTYNHSQKKSKKNPRKAKKERQTTCCPTCGAPIQMVPVSEMNFPFDYTKEKEGEVYYWRCSHYPACDTYIKADPRTKKPSGLMAGPELRHKRICIHHWMMFLTRAGFMTPGAFWSMCGSHMGLHNCNVVHARDMTNYQCDSILRYLKCLYENNAKVKAIIDAHPDDMAWRQANGVEPHINV